MRPNEIRATGEVATGAYEGIVGVVEQVHKQIARRSFKHAGPGSAGAHILHDGISQGVYSGVRSIGKAAQLGVSQIVAELVPAQAQSLTQHPAGSVAVGMLNGAVGDALESRQNELARSMAIRHRGTDVAPNRATLAHTFAQATPRIVVFVHGLCESAQAWQAVKGSARYRGDYGSCLAQELGFTPLYLSYNSGLHVSDNGRLLADLLEQVTSAWPTAVEEIALVGHSMGGLVARSASHNADHRGMRWIGQLRHLVSLGSPNRGAPLEQAANIAGWTLGQAPETKPFASVVNGRSAGIKDMRFGACIEDDWRGYDPDELLTDRCLDIGFVEDVDYHFVAATITRSTTNPVGALLGDLVVRLPSASGHTRAPNIDVGPKSRLTIGGVNHFTLLNHPSVYEKLAAWLSQGS
jgi:pimeloyl-ACP methyl ester carboxylesterase